MHLDLIIMILAMLGVVLFGLGLRQVWRRKLLRGGLQGLSGALLILGAALFSAVSLNLYTYHRLTNEQAVVEVLIRALGPQTYRVYVQREAGEAESFDLRGDEWQVDARILKWSGLASLLGLDTVYRLERISGRYRDLAQERYAPHTVYSLADSPGLDLWMLAREHQGWFPWVDALYGSAVYLPLADDARYAITISGSGLVARPLNRSAQEAVANWK